MPDITAAGTYIGSDDGFSFLNETTGDTVILFSDGTLPTTLEVKYVDDQGVDRVLEDGTITTLPSSIVVSTIKRPLKIVATGGSPSFNVTGTQKYERSSF